MEDWSERGELPHLLPNVLPAYWKHSLADKENKRAKTCMAVRIMSLLEQHLDINEYVRRHLGAPERMISLKNSLYVEVFGETAGGRPFRLNNVKWSEKLKLQMIPAEMSLDSTIQYLSVKLMLNSRIEAILKTVTIMKTMIAARVEIIERSKQIAP